MFSQGLPTGTLRKYAGWTLYSLLTIRAQGLLHETLRVREQKHIKFFNTVDFRFPLIVALADYFGKAAAIMSKFGLKSFNAMKRKRILLTLTVASLFLSVKMYGQTRHNRSEAEDRVAIKELIDAYSRNADRRHAKEQAMLFTKDAVVEIYHAEPKRNTKPDAVLISRDTLEKAFGVLRKYDVTMHFNGQSTIRLHGDSATGEIYCLAHHIWVSNGKRMLMVIGIRYYDDYVYRDGTWFFKKRKLIFDFTDVHESHPEEPQ